MNTLSEFLDKEYSSFIGKKVTAVRTLTEEEVSSLCWDLTFSDIPFVLIFDDGQALIPSRDPEGNGPGFLISADLVDALD